MDELRPGDVVRRNRKVGLVLRANASDVLLWPVAYRERQRAMEVSVVGRDLFELDAPRHAVICAGTLRRLTVRGQVRIGVISDDLLHACERAAQQDAETRAVIARWQADFAHRRDECAAAAGML